MGTELTGNAHTVVRADGEIDLSNIQEFTKALDEAAERSPGGFIIDLSDAMYIDSAGVQAILSAYLRIHQAEGLLALVVGNIRIKAVLEAVNLEQLPRLHVCDNLDAAKQEIT